MSTPRRWSITLGLLVLVSMLIAACIPVAPPSPAPEEGEALPEGAAKDQVLKVVWEGSMGNGPVPGLDIGSAAFPLQAYRTCLMFNSENSLMPDSLCDRYTANEDNTVFSFHINPKAVWSDGKKVTAQDFVDWYNFIFHPDRASWTPTYVFGPVLGLQEYLDGEADTIAGFNAVDNEILEIALWRSEGWFPQRMAWRWSAPARVDNYAHLLERASEFATAQDWWGAISEVWLKDNAKNLIISGPFKYVYLEPEPAAIYKLEQNPNWWGEKPIITAIEGTTIRDFQTMLLLFENGEVDIALSLSGPPAVLLRRQRPEVFHEIPSYDFAAMFMNAEKEPTDDINLRKALLHAIEWEQVAAVAWEGERVAMNAGTLLTPNMPCYDPNYQPYPFDPEQAKEYLAQSMYGPTGATVPKIRILTAGSDPPRIRAAQIIQEMWRVNLGIENVEIKNAEAEFADGQGQVAIRVSSSGAPGPLPASLLEWQAHSRGGSAQEFTLFSTPELDTKIDHLLTLDPNSEAYCPAVQEVLEEIEDAAVVIPTSWWQGWYQIQPWVQGFDLGVFPEWVTGWVMDTGTWLAER